MSYVISRNFLPFDSSTLTVRKIPFNVNVAKKVAMLLESWKTPNVEKLFTRD